MTRQRPLPAAAGVQRPRRSSRWRAPHRWFLLAGSAVVTLGPMLPEPLRGPLFAVVAVSVLAAMVVGVRRYRPVWPLPWWLLGGAVLAGFVASVYWSLWPEPAGGRAFPTLGDLCYGSIFPLLTGVALSWTRRTPSAGRLNSGVDVGVVAFGTASVLWIFVADPLLHRPGLGTLPVAADLAYAGFDLAIIVLVARVALTTRLNALAYRLVLSASVLMVAMTTIDQALLGAGHGGPNLATTAGFLATYVMAGGAALHPSMAHAAGWVERVPSRVSAARVAAYLLLIAVSTGLTGYEFVVASRRGGSPAWTAVPLLLGAGLSVLLVIRLGQLAFALNRRATRDVLTGLGNRTLLRDALTGPRRAGSGGVRSVLLIDLDDFRDINDSFGEAGGDRVLVELAGRLRQVVPADAIVARLDGDEFAVLLDGAGGADAFAVADDILDAVRPPFELPQGRAYTTASIGVRPVAGDSTASGLLRDANLALSAAKLAGRNQVVGYDERLRAERDERTGLVAGLHRGLAQGEFTVYYQPIVELRTGEIVAAEALLRWFPPDGEPVPPGVFIPVAEQSGIVVPIGTWVLRQVCADLRELYPAHGLSVTVNVSARQLRDESFANTVLDLLRADGLPGQALIIEITETVLITSVADALTVTAQLERLRESGVRIAIDDFGTGYSSLSYLRELPVDVLKMDGSFTDRQSQREERDAAFIAAILNLSASLDLPTIAEAVETAEQAQWLAELGCRLGQGYHFARPAPVGALRELLRAQRPSSTALPATP